AVDTAHSHGAPLGEDEVRATKEVIGVDPDATFVVPEGVYEHMGLAERGSSEEAAWRERLDAWSAEYPDLRASWDQTWSGEVDARATASLPTFDSNTPIATRSAGQKVMHAFAEHVPTMVGGAADLVASTKTDFPEGGMFSSIHAGRNVAFGIRENAMGSIVNGLALHGGIVRPYGSTFLVFSDYMRPAVRLSALAHLPVVWIWTHDSIGLGEDGPTHQPVEHYMALRAIPNLVVLRPGDANETSYAWKVALERKGGPVALLLSRQNLPVLARDGESGVADAAGVERGAYVLWESSRSEPPGILLIATGSEVSLALEAGRTLAADGVGARVVSMPSWELFEEQDEAYRHAVLPPDVKARLAIETGVTLGWERWVGDRGDTIGVDRYGASAPGQRVLEEYGFTIDNVLRRATALISAPA
ncbi:MAG: transketolase C-terminal domain-containing protein, partial [Gaiellales bacterium]